MNNNETSVITQTQTTEDNNTLMEVQYPIFLAFAEYLGYVSPNIEWVMNLCKGKDIPTYQKNILKVESSVIYDKMVEEFTIATMRELFEQYYDLILYEYETKYNALEETSDLPF